MPHPKFSVLLPTHNRSDVLGLAIASVLQQTCIDFELLIVADGCTDDTASVVASLTDPRIRFFDLPKAPYFGYANRNMALREARGELIAFAAHDDLLLPDHLECMAALLAREQADWGYSQPLWVSTDGYIVPFYTNLTIRDELESFLHKGNTIPAACIVHTRAILEQVGYWPEDLTSMADWALWRKMISASSHKLAYLATPTNLHFSANWKKSRFADMLDVKTWVELAEKMPWWPAILHIPPHQGQTEQAAIWLHMQVAGPAWGNAMRDAIDLVTDRIAWIAIKKISRRDWKQRLVHLRRNGLWAGILRFGSSFLKNEAL